MLNTTGPCDWPIASPPVPGEDDEDVLACAPCSALTDLSETERELVEGMAVELLWAWSGRKYGTCAVSVRPCRETCTERPPTFWGSSGISEVHGQVGGWTPALIQGQWYNLRCGVCPSNRCSCSQDLSRSIELPGPVAGITEIWVDGVLLPDTAYTVRSGVLLRLDGGTWPMCNDDFTNPREVDSGAWEVVYKRGYPVPPGGQLAAYTLACELAKARCDDNTCQLPRRLQTVSRQGVTVGILDSFEGLDDGRTGIWEIDSWLSSVSYKPTSPPQVFSPDIPAGTGRGTLGGLAFGGYR